MTRVLILNDTSVASNHFGCQLVGATLREQLCRVGMDVVGSLKVGSNLEEIDALKDIFDFIIVNGEGSIHDGKNGNLIKIAGKYPAALVNAVYQRNPVYDEIEAFKVVATRESWSAAEIGKQRDDCFVVPDFLFASTQVTAFANLLRARRRLGTATIARPLGRTDSVTSRKLRLGPLRIRLSAGRRPFGGTPVAHLNYFASSARMAVGRFHAACASAALGVPFASWDSNTWKTEAMMADMGAVEWHFRTEKEAVAAAPSAVIPESMSSWVEQAPAKIWALFDHIAETAAPYSRNEADPASS
jgi:hypothetical protein